MSRSQKISTFEVLINWSIEKKLTRIYWNISLQKQGGMESIKHRGQSITFNSKIT